MCAQMFKVQVDCCRIVCAGARSKRTLVKGGEKPQRRGRSPGTTNLGSNRAQGKKEAPMRAKIRRSNDGREDW
jgi:hypothetical protein